jgi:hypothetical protein
MSPPHRAHFATPAATSAATILRSRWCGLPYPRAAVLGRGVVMLSMSPRVAEDSSDRVDLRAALVTAALRGLAMFHVKHGTRGAPQVRGSSARRGGYRAACDGPTDRRLGVEALRCGPWASRTLAGWLEGRRLSPRLWSFPVSGWPYMVGLGYGASSRQAGPTARARACRAAARYWLPPVPRPGPAWRSCLVRVGADARRVHRSTCAAAPSLPWRLAGAARRHATVGPSTPSRSTPRLACPV